MLSLYSIVILPSPPNMASSSQCLPCSSDLLHSLVRVLSLHGPAAPNPSSETQTSIYRLSAVMGLVPEEEETVSKTKFHKRSAEQSRCLASRNSLLLTTPMLTQGQISSNKTRSLARMQISRGVSDPTPLLMLGQIFSGDTGKTLQLTRGQISISEMMPETASSADCPTLYRVQKLMQSQSIHKHPQVFVACLWWGTSDPQDEEVIRLKIYVAKIRILQRGRYYYCIDLIVLHFPATPFDFALIIVQIRLTLHLHENHSMTTINANVDKYARAFSVRKHPCSSRTADESTTEAKQPAVSCASSEAFVHPNADFQEYIKTLLLTFEQISMCSMTRSFARVQILTGDCETRPAKQTMLPEVIDSIKISTSKGSFAGTMVGSGVQLTHQTRPRGRRSP